ncbi:McrC family protein [Aliivibrio sp. SR45-2]|uniref:McrC family protein n=1 Tax=Aliivibrio sp. SR45-2 TaxID=2760931 RepID=UPI0015FBED1A|nr:McrC family protein [Aliivibrio sp. SR45-2]MBB1314184.1 McrC family protein [Aliivibrio sp. SR45-2]
MASHPVVFEFGYLTAESAAADESGFTLISKENFRYLESLCLTQQDTDVNQFLQLKTRYGCKVLQVKNYVGVIFTPHGEHIEVLPKIGKRARDKKQAITDARKTLLMMLKHLGDFRHISTNTASVETLQMPLLEIFIEEFLQSVNQLVKRGLRSDYVKREDNLAFQKGKLLVSKQVRHNVINKHKFYVEYDEFLQDRPANRLLRAALKKVSGFTSRHKNQRLLRELDFAFDCIPPSTNPKDDFARIKIDRGMSYYHSPLAWAKLILEGLSPLSMKGTAEAQSLLFPMEMVFENYVASVLGENLPEGTTLRTQVTSKYLTTHNGKNQFQLRPDLMITNSDQSSIVLDTKWKLIDLNAYHYGISQSDLYQMFAYGHNYLDGTGDLFLIYPAHEYFNTAVEHSFEFSEKLRLWIVPFVISLTGNSSIKWPEALKLQAYKTHE